MSTSPNQKLRQELRDALVSAFPERSSLEQLLYYELDKNLNLIAPDSKLDIVVFELIRTAESEGWLVDLISAARKENPGNSQLEAVTSKFKLSSTSSEGTSSHSPQSQQQRILILAANPIGTSPLRLEEELREIEEGLRQARQREQFEIKLALAARVKDIHRSILEFQPQIVHFSGHGAGQDGLVFTDDTGQTKLVDGDALANLFKLFANRINCVVLNACYSEVQARAIAQHINYVVGMSEAVGDRAAIEFAVGFYDALWAGESIEFAHKLGCWLIQMQGISEQLTPKLLIKPSVVGDWAWDRRAFPATIHEDGTVTGNDGGQEISADWHYISDKKDKIKVTWNTGAIDTLTLTENGNALLDCNNGRGELVILRSSSQNNSAENVPCSQVIGDWSWGKKAFPTSIYEDGTVLANNGSQENKGVLIKAKWTCLNHDRGEIKVEWEKNFTDILTFSPDGNTLTGANNHGVRLVVTRRR